MRDITQNELKQNLHYDPDSGVFTRVRTGAVAGSVHKGSGYVRIKIGQGNQYAAHRLAFLYMTGRLPVITDHINHVRCDNRWVNLREVTTLENSQNCRLQLRNKSGVHGVHWHSRDLVWVARIRGSGVRDIGRSADYFEAVCMRKSAEVNLGYHWNHGTY